jgi:long-chain acyl-CoA synthetase
MADHERIMRTRLVPDIWSPATGELSASLKLKRKTVEEKYKSLIESVYPK